MQNLLKSRRSPALIAGFVSAILWSVPVGATLVSYTVTNLNGSPTSSNVIENSGSYLGAVNVGAGTSGATQTVNGVTFNPGAQTSDGTTNFFSSGLSISYSSPDSTAGTGARSGINDRYEGSFQEVMRLILFSGGNGTLSLSLDGLAPERDYRVQFLMDDLFKTDSTYEMDITADPPNSGNIGSPNGFSVGQTGGKSVLGFFTTDPAQTSISFSLDAIDGTDRSVLSGVSVFDVTAVPEPTTAMLLALGSLLLLLRARRFRSLRGAGVAGLSILFMSALMTVTPVDAAVVTYDITNMNGSPTSSNIVENTGIYVGAVNMWAGTSASDEIVNGVTFKPGAQNKSFSYNFTDSGLTVTWDAPSVGGGGRRDTISGRYEGAAFTEVMELILFSAGNSTITLTLAGLKAESNYRVQFLMDDLNQSSSSYEMEITADAPNSGNIGSPSGFSVGQSGGKSVLGTFTTDPGQTSIVFSLDAIDGTDRSVLSGISVFQIVPEPDTLSMLLVGLVSILGIRRSLQRRTC